MTGKNCDSCGNYNAYYVKAYDHFRKIKMGKCIKKQATTECDGVCKHWKDNGGRAEEREKISLDDLNRAVKSIREIAQILKERE